MVRSPLGDTEKRLLGCWGWLGKSKFCSKRNKQPISENMEPVQPGKSTPTTMCMYCAHSHTHKSDCYSYSMSNFISHLVNQPHKLHNMYTVWWFGFILILGPSQRLHCVTATFALVGFITAFLSAAIPQWFLCCLYPKRPPHMSWTYDHYIIYCIFWIHKVS